MTRKEDEESRLLRPNRTRYYSDTTPEEYSVHNWRTLSPGPKLNQFFRESGSWDRAMTESPASSLHGSARLDRYDFTRPEWHPVDVLQNISSLRNQHLVVLDKDGKRAAHYARLWIWRALQIPILLVLLSFITAMVGEAMHRLIQFLFSFRWVLVKIGTETSFWKDPSAMLIYLTFAFVLVMSSSVITQWHCPVAIGGGVPEVKALLQGSSNIAMRSFRLAWVKFIGVVFATGAGLSVGLEGPLIQIACTCTGLLLHLKMFKYTHQDAAKNLKLLTCACAAGVAATFGSAFGSTLFSIEITSTCYMVTGLPQAFMAALIVVFLSSRIGYAKRNVLYQESAREDRTEPSAFVDLALWVAFGVLLGILSILFVSSTAAISSWRNRITRASLGVKLSRYRRLLITLCFSCISIPCGLLEILYCEYVSNEKHNPHALLDHMFGKDELRGYVSWHLMVYIPIKLLAILLSICQPIPVGLFSPVFLLGASVGRLFGEALNSLETWNGLEFSFDPYQFAIVGAAAFSGSVTRTISPAVIVYELSGEPELRVPMGIVLLVAYFISSLFTKGIYESLMDTGGQPVLPPLPRKSYEVEVQKIMTKCKHATSRYKTLYIGARYEYALEILEECPEARVIPVVKSLKCRTLVGSVLRCDLEIALSDYELVHENFKMPTSERDVMLNKDSNATTIDTSTHPQEGDGSFLFFLLSLCCPLLLPTSHNHRLIYMPDFDLPCCPHSRRHHTLLPHGMDWVY